MGGRGGDPLAAPGLGSLAAGLFRLPRIHRHHGTMSMPILRAALGDRGTIREIARTPHGRTRRLVQVTRMTRVTGTRLYLRRRCDRRRGRGRIVGGEGDDRGSGNEGGGKGQFQCVHGIRCPVRAGFGLRAVINPPFAPLTPATPSTPQDFLRNRARAQKLSKWEHIRGARFRLKPGLRTGRLSCSLRAVRTAHHALPPQNAFS